MAFFRIQGLYKISSGRFFVLSPNKAVLNYFFNYRVYHTTIFYLSVEYYESFVLRNPPLRQAPNRWLPIGSTT